MNKKKVKKKKSKLKTYEIMGYYYDGKTSYTIVMDPNKPSKTIMIKGAA